MKCDEVARMMAGLGEQHLDTFEQSYMVGQRDETAYQDTNDDPTDQRSRPQNAHPDHHHICHSTKVHSVRKVAMLGEVDMPPFFEKLGEFDITGLVHADMKEKDAFMKVVMRDAKAT